MSDLEKLALPEIRELITAGDRDTLCEVLNEWGAPDLGDLITDLNDAEDIYTFGCLRPELAAKTFGYLERPAQQELVSLLPEEEVARVLELLAPDDRTAFLESLNEAETERLLTLLSPGEQRVARGLLSYGEGTVGRLMTPDFVTVRRDWDVDQVLRHVRKVGRDSETLNVLYVVDEHQHLIDDIRIREVLLSPPERTIGELMHENHVALLVTDKKEAAVEQFRKYDRSALPVVDGRGVLVGIVTVDDVLDVVEEVATREIQQFGGLEALDEPYVDTPLLVMVRKRASWLIILFLGEMLTATAMGYFEHEIQRAVVLALFVPLIISSGGNSGSQAATLIVRALAVGEVTLSRWWFVMRREIISGLLLGLILGTIGFMRIAVWSTFSTIYGEHWLLVALTVSISLVGIVLWGTLSGSMLPFLLKRVGFDPATSSAPFVATLVDVTGLVIYFTVATIVLRGTLL